MKSGILNLLEPLGPVLNLLEPLGPVLNLLEPLGPVQACIGIALPCALPKCFIFPSVFKIHIHIHMDAPRAEA